MALQALIARVLAICIGFVLFCFGVFLFDDEQKRLDASRRKLQDILDGWWIKLDDTKRKALDLHVSWITATKQQIGEREAIRSRFPKALVVLDKILRSVIRHTVICAVVFFFIRRSDLWRQADLRFYQLVGISILCTFITVPIGLLLIPFKKLGYNVYLTGAFLVLVLAAYTTSFCLLLIYPFNSRILAVAHVTAVTMIPLILGVFVNLLLLAILILNRLLWPLTSRVFFAVTKIPGRPSILVTVGVGLIAWGWPAFGQFLSGIAKLIK
ncbi:MAG TPA: hypothetical protein VJW20_07250 [Candidatus Angelobacter sp.]|nr:hypothetical protein [Candidatus Angelobacter sp.]